MKHLSSLLSPEILSMGICITTAEGLYEYLRHEPKVASVRNRLAIQAIDLADLNFFISDITRKIEIGKRSAWDVTFAAIAVALERKPGPFADRYLNDLANLEITELPLSSRIARQVLKHRESLACNVSSTVIFSRRKHRDSGPVIVRKSVSDPHPRSRKNNADYCMLEVV